jgi:gamma-glutamyltranspeptidase/glutathione hydrolase
VDAQGNAVAVTTTLNGSYGSGVTVPGGGFLLNNEMDDFMVEPGGPNMFGLIQGEANAIEPRKRPLSAMTPTIVKKGGKPFLVLGSPGGPTIINTVFQIILNVVDHERDIQEAVDAPRVHHQWMPDYLIVEKNSLPRDVTLRLAAMGHQIQVRSQIGDAHAILVDSAEHVLLGAADPRSDSKASGY